MNRKLISDLELQALKQQYLTTTGLPRGKTLQGALLDIARLLTTLTVMQERLRHTGAEQHGLLLTVMELMRRLGVAHKDGPAADPGVEVTQENLVQVIVDHEMVISLPEIYDLLISDGVDREQNRHVRLWRLAPKALTKETHDGAADTSQDEGAEPDRSVGNAGRPADDAGQGGGGRADGTGADDQAGRADGGSASGRRDGGGIVLTDG